MTTFGTSHERGVVSLALARALAQRPHGESLRMGESRMSWRDRTTGRTASIVMTDADDGVRIEATIDDGGPATVDPADPASSPALAAIATAFPHPLGRILDRVETDRHGNDVSIVLLRGGRRLRMVHHPKAKAHHRTTRSTIYRGRGEFVRVSYAPGRSDCHSDELDVAGHRISWGDGDLLGVDAAPGGLDLGDRVRTHVPFQSVEDAILAIVSGIVDDDASWERRDVPARIAA